MSLADKLYSLNDQLIKIEKPNDPNVRTENLETQANNGITRALNYIKSLLNAVKRAVKRRN